MRCSGGDDASSRPDLIRERRSTPTRHMAVARGTGASFACRWQRTMTGPGAAAWVPDLIPDGFRRAAQATVVYHPCSVNSMLPLGSTCNTRTSGALALGVAVVTTFFVGAGRPKAGWSNLMIRHLVPAASWGDIVAGENRADGRRWRHSTP